MAWKTFFGFLFFILVVVLLGLYWFFPFNASDFIYLNSGYESSNFSEVLEGSNDSVSDVQFYQNMRYPTNEISYRISNRCTLQKEDEMERALELLDARTILYFYPSENAEILISCQNRDKPDGDFFVAGEGGPTEIRRAGDFNVIFQGEILLIRESKCANPNVALHELLHVLGFDHSANPNNIMYNISRCEQELGDDTVDFINEIYSIPSLPDLEFESAEGEIKGRYLDLNFTLRNNGLKDSQNSVVKIYLDDDLVKEIEVEELEIGYGRTFTLTNLFVTQLKVEELKLVVISSESELDKDNNELKMGLK